MAITVNFDGITATINEGKWSTDKDTDFKGVFEGVLTEQLQTDLTTGLYGTVAEPDIDMRSATLMSRRFAGKITDTSKHEPPEHGEEDRGRGDGMFVVY